MPCPLRRAAVPAGLSAVALLCVCALGADPHAAPGVDPGQAPGAVDPSVQAILDRGRDLLARADHAAAKQALLEAAAAARRLDDAGGESAALDLLGTVSLTRADARAAERYFGQALALRRAAGDAPGEAQTLANLALALERLDVEQALDTHHLAIARWRALGNGRAEATTLHNVAELYLRLDAPDRALEYASAALEGHRRFGPQAGIAHTLEHVGAAHEALGRLDRARSAYEDGLAASRFLSSRWIESDLLIRLGALDLAAGARDTARSLFTEALSAARAVGRRGGEAEALVYLGHTARAGREWDAASQAYEAALALSLAFELPRVQTGALAGLAELARERRDIATALAYSARVIARVEAARAGAARDEVRRALLDATHRHYRRHVSLLLEMHDEAPGAGHDRTAYAFAERARARTLLETLADGRARIRRNVDPSLAEEERAVQDRLARAADQLTRELSLGRNVAAARRDVDAAVADYEGVRARIRQASPGYAALVDPQPLGAAEVQRLLEGDDTVLLQYALLDDRSVAWAIDAAGVEAVRLPPRGEIEPLVNRAYGLLTARNLAVSGESPARRRQRIAEADREWADLSRVLSALLLRPVQARLGKARLVVVSDGVLQYLGFAALPDPSNRRHEPLIHGHEVIRLPSASVLPWLRDPPTTPRADRPLVVFADPVFTGDDPRVSRAGASPAVPEPGALPRLRFTRDEALAIAAAAPRGAARLALDFDASLDAATAPEIGRYRIVHLATHGVLDTSQPALSGLVLSRVDRGGRHRPGHLRLADVYNLPLNADLVVLSACETALGRDSRGEGLVGLTRGFMYAGAPRVIASLWRINDRATASLMAALYRSMLRDARGPARALRDAQNAVRREPGWEAPYYWAAFEFQGRWR